MIQLRGSRKNNTLLPGFEDHKGECHAVERCALLPHGLKGFAAPFPRRTSRSSCAEGIRRCCQMEGSDINKRSASCILPVALTNLQH